MGRPTILTFVHYYLPGFRAGGPVRTIANMVDHLGDELDFWIVTRDRDALALVDTPYSDVQVNAWNCVGRAHVYYCGPGNISLGAFATLMRKTPHDVVYLNSFFDPVFTLRPLLNRRIGRSPMRPVVVAPRGEFSAGAFALKRWRKLPYLAVARAFGLYRGLIWQASSEHEVEDIRRFMGRSAEKVCVAPNMPPSLIRSSSKANHGHLIDGTLQVVFLSLIGRMKNLDFALQVLARVKVPVTFNIYGPIWDQEYWRRCESLIAMLPEKVKAHYFGAVQPEEVGQVMSDNDLLFLPTRGENFGHVILESLSAGTPVLISDQTPWRDDNLGGCTVLPLSDQDAFARALEHHHRISDSSRRQARIAARAVAQSFIDDERLIERNMAMFRNAIEGNGISSKYI